MCEWGYPLQLGLLHALRLCAARPKQASADGLQAWLQAFNLEGAGPILVDLVATLAADTDGPRLFAPPGTVAIWPHELGLLEALAAVSHAPERAGHRLGFLDAAQQARVLDLLAGLAECLSAGAATRLRAFRHPQPLSTSTR